MNRRVLVVIAGWLVGAVVATAVGIAAIRAVGSDLSGSSVRTLTKADVERELASAQSQPSVSPTPAQPTPIPTPTETSTATPRAAPTTQAKVLTSAGGSVLARCVDGMVSLDWWTPAQGFGVDNVERGPASEVKVEFESGSTDVELRIRCVGGVPTAEVDD